VVLQTNILYESTNYTSLCILGLGMYEHDHVNLVILDTFNINKICLTKQKRLKLKKPQNLQRLTYTTCTHNTCSMTTWWFYKQTFLINEQHILLKLLTIILQNKGTLDSKDQFFL
jgi:hypothetical protein